MKSLNLKQLTIVFFVLFLTIANGSYAQELNVGVDLVNRYVWRGADIGDSNPSIQPTVEFGIAGFTAGFWGAYSFSNSNSLEEIDLYINYALELPEAGEISLGFMDYTNPNNGIKLGNFYNFDDPQGPGAHTIEMNANYTGPESFPISLSYNMFLYNAENNPIYVELGYAATINEVGLNAFIGGTPGDDALYYNVEKFSIINVGLTASKTIKITDSFNIPLFGSVMLNPADEKMFYVIGVSF